MTTNAYIASLPCIVPQTLRGLASGANGGIAADAGRTASGEAKSLTRGRQSLFVIFFQFGVPLTLMAYDIAQSMIYRAEPAAVPYAWSQAVLGTTQFGVAANYRLRMG